MRRTCSFTIALLLASSGALAATPAGAMPTKPSDAVVKHQTPPGSEANAAINGAVAGVLVGALTEQFGGRQVSVKLDKFDVQPTSIRDRSVSGQGRVQIGNDQDWIGFRFSTLYDTLMGSAAYPEITLGGITDNEREVPNDSRLVGQLDNTVVDRLGKEFANQRVRLQLDRIVTVEAGSRYLRISAIGIADFGRDGSTPAQVEALYDRHDSAWLRVSYELGPTTAAPDSDDNLVAGG